MLKSCGLHNRNYPNKKPPNYNANKNHQTFHPSTITTIINATKYYIHLLLHTLFMSNSPHTRVLLFGSTSLAKSSKSVDCGIAHQLDYGPPIIILCHNSSIGQEWWPTKDPGTTTEFICHHKEHELKNNIRTHAHSHYHLATHHRIQSHT